ncbi:MAG: cytochrome c [Phenylobacterium sp.]|jgi:mono/diheme cytochrome c family protein|uniref:c-type cytochrome n=1 Tax=Phenylobacterium sp. TaxID=1871053 RepID=UPI0025D5483F|nr:cytochrome c [Phenylobacterium sp.]MCA3708553.1 cytochrome c [Phenylobacterium sp.]MCA3711444.1 cytochrome c [Phenylobacterium sp.]MCA3714157.1 cytochrome c [Phenylobacterium sp.]MCA3723742.1 cytochrome c [Phenylobacterium sp.]MCA3727131.1 cytochrome c [Phenylobacterium sp.]
MRLIVATVLPGALALVLAGCATTGGEDGPSAARGRLLAEAQCGTCHAVTGEAQPGQAPSFSSLAARYRAHSLRARLTEIDETGHFNMPPLKMGDADVEDIAAWLDSLPLP